jgi:hypothetical protein
MESMAYSFGTQQDSIIELLVVPRITLTAMKVNGKFEAKFGCLCFSLVDEVKESVNLWVVVLFTHKIKTTDHI